MEGIDVTVDSWELTHFLCLFRAAYARALELDLQDIQDVLRDEFYLREQFQKSFYGPTTAAREVAKLFAADKGDDELRFRAISYSSPLVITCICLASALTLAVILSGGKAQFMGFRFTLPPLGTGIKSLREAFGLSVPTRRRLK